MAKLSILNSKETKKILEVINIQFNAKLDLSDYAVMINKENKCYIVSRKFADIDESKLRINNIGLYIGEFREDEFRPSIEGAQLIAKTAESNVFCVDDDKARQFLKGNNITENIDSQNYIILKNNGDVIGTGKPKDSVVLNYNPKTRRILCD